MKHRGYDIVKTSHPIPCNPHREAYDIMDGEKVLKVNVSTVETAKAVIDALIRTGIWLDRSKTI